MSVSRPLFSVIGFMVMLTALLSYFVSMDWLLLGVLIGISLIQVPFTKLCPLDVLIRRLPWTKEGVKMSCPSQMEAAPEDNKKDTEQGKNEEKK